jgi:hypothetical protein
MHVSLTRICVASAIALAATCSFAADVALTDVTSKVGESAWMSGVYAAGDHARWNSMWQRHLDGQDLDVAPPRFDFNGATLIGVSLGFTNRCERLSMTRVDVDGSRAVITYRRDDNSGNCDSSQARPLHAFALIAAKAGEVVARPEDD